MSNGFAMMRMHTRPPRHHEMCFCDWGRRAVILAAPESSFLKPQAFTDASDKLRSQLRLFCFHSSTILSKSVTEGEHANTPNCFTPTLHFLPKDHICKAELMHLSVSTTSCLPTHNQPDIIRIHSLSQDKAGRTHINRLCESFHFEMRFQNNN